MKCLACIFEYVPGMDFELPLLLPLRLIFWVSGAFFFVSYKTISVKTLIRISWYCPDESTANEEKTREVNDHLLVRLHNKR